MKKDERLFLERIAEEREKLEQKKLSYLDKASTKIKAWTKDNGHEIYTVYHVDCKVHVYIYIFYKTDEELAACKKSGITRKTRAKYLEYLREDGYFVEFPPGVKYFEIQGCVREFESDIEFVFDSDENVKRNYAGNYGYRLLD